MPFDGAGNFSRVHNWTSDKDNGILITSVRHDAEDDGFADAFNLVLLRNGVVAMTGDLQMGGNSVTGLESGAAATPSVRFTADTQTGLFLAAAGVLGVAVSGVERARFTSTGAKVTGTLEVTEELGIGTSAPRTALDVVGISSFRAAFEEATVSAFALTGAVNLDVSAGPLFILTANAAGNWTFNVRVDGATSLNSVMAVNQVLTIAVEVPQGATPYYCTAITIDGNAPASTKWQGGAPTGGNPSGVDVYLIRILKTGAATFAVRASLAQET